MRRHGGSAVALHTAVAVMPPNVPPCAEVITVTVFAKRRIAPLKDSGDIDCANSLAIEFSHLYAICDRAIPFKLTSESLLKSEFFSPVAFKIFQRSGRKTRRIQNRHFRRDGIFHAALA
jgi:hypothetical protein